MISDKLQQDNKTKNDDILMLNSYRSGNINESQENDLLRMAQ